MPAIRHDDILLRLIKDVSYIRSILNKIVVNLPLFDIANENTPTQLTANQNDYVIGNYDVLRLTSDADRTITGLRRGVKGRSLQIFNVGNFVITLAHQSASSTAEYRFAFATGTNHIILPGSSIKVYYDSTQERWIEGTKLESSGIHAEYSPAQITANQNNYDVTDYDVLRLSTDAERTITGLAGGAKGRFVDIFNVGSYAIILSHQSGSSDAANRFDFSTGVNHVIAPDSSIRLYYDSTDSRWKEGTQLEGGGILKEKTPSQITANQNNYNATDYDVLRLSSNAARDITGLTGGAKGRQIKLLNIGSYPITLVNQSGSSTAANRFKFSSGEDLVIPPGSNMTLYYDSTQSRWIGGDYQSSGAVYGAAVNTNAQNFAATAYVDFGAETADQYGFIDIANDKIDIKFDGFYVVIYAFGVDTVTGTFNLLYFLNGNQTYFGASEYLNDDEWMGSAVYAGYLSEGDYLKIRFGISTNMIIYADATLVIFKVG